MKKASVVALCTAACLTLSACGSTPAVDTPKQAPTAAVQTPAPSPSDELEPSPTPEATSEPPQMSMLSEENAPARAAYGAALNKLLDTGVLPDGTGDSGGYIGSIEDRERMAQNRFSVCDVDGDGREELILLYTTTIVAGERGFVYDWDEATGELRKQLEEFPLLTFYDNGAVMAGWSHNQGNGGSFWPYFLYQYLPETDSYQQVGAVDAWDKALGLEGYPDEVDASKTGFVYYITTEGDITWDHPVDASQYQAWLAPYLGEARELSTPYVELTAEQIQMLQTPG